MICFDISSFLCFWSWDRVEQRHRTVWPLIEEMRKGRAKPAEKILRAGNIRPVQTVQECAADFQPWKGGSLKPSARAVGAAGEQPEPGETGNSNWLTGCRPLRGLVCLGFRRPGLTTWALRLPPASRAEERPSPSAQVDIFCGFRSPRKIPQE
jgi:hypothetical protein